MAIVAANVTLGQSLGDGRYNTSEKGGALPAASLTALNAAITSALAVAASIHDSTPEINAIQTQVNALTLALTADLAVVFNTSAITNHSALNAAIDRAKLSLRGTSILTP